MKKDPEPRVEDRVPIRKDAKGHPDRRNFLYSAGLGASSMALLGPLQSRDGGVQKKLTPTTLSSGSSTFLNCCVVDSVPDLRALLPPGGSSAVMFVRGFSRAGDGGQGSFYWDPDEDRPDNDGFIVTPNSSSGNGRWRRDWDGNRLNVKWFGAQGDGLNDDHAPIQKALLNAPAHGAVFFPPGDYRITLPLQIINDPAGKMRHLRLFGSNAGARGEDRTRLVWNGDPNGDMLELRSRNCIIEHLDFIVSADPPGEVRAAVLIGPNDEGAPPTNNIFRHCNFQGATATTPSIGLMHIGVLVDDAPGNLDFFRFIKCQFRGQLEAGVFLNNVSNQSKGHTFEDCSFVNPDEPAGTGIKAVTGSLQCYSCFFRGFDRAVHTATMDSLVFVDTESERCRRFLDTNLNGARTSKEWPVILLGGFFNIDQSDFATSFSDGTPFDGQYVLYTHGGQLLVQGCLFDTGLTFFDTFKIETIGRTVDTPALISIGNRFPTDSPYSANGTRHRLISLGNHGLTMDPMSGAISRIDLPDELVQNGPLAGMTRLNLQGLAGSGINNLRGRVNIPTGQLAQTVAFPVAEPDADYFVSASVNFASTAPGAPGSMGAQAAASVADKTATGFEIRLGSTLPFDVDVDWILIR